MFGPGQGGLFCRRKKLAGMSPDRYQRKLLRADTGFCQHTRVQIHTEGTPVKLADPQVNQIQKMFIQAAVAEIVFHLTVGQDACSGRPGIVNPVAHRDYFLLSGVVSFVSPVSATNTASSFAGAVLQAFRLTT